MTGELRIKHRLMSFKRTVFVEIYARPTFDDRRATNDGLIYTVRTRSSFPRLDLGTRGEGGAGGRERVQSLPVRRSGVPQNGGVQSRCRGRRWGGRRSVLVVFLVGRVPIFLLLGHRCAASLARANWAVILRAIAAFLRLEVRAGP